MISIIIPFYNEKENLPLLVKKLIKEGKRLTEPYEVIFIDDGSLDNFQFSIFPKRIPSKFFGVNNFQKNIKLIKHRKRFGKGKALLTGFKESKGDTIVFMDADLQNDPHEVSKFIQTIEKGFDFVNGWRIDRKDPLSKKIPSYIFNTVLLKFFFKSKFHDINCGYKAMRREVLDQIPLYGDNYRFLPIMAEQEGFKTTELEVKHYPRMFGSSKYGLFRLLSGLFDTITTYFVYKFSDKPLHFFGPIGASLFFGGFFITINLTIGRIFYGMQLYRRPLLLFGTLLIIVGIQFVMTGFIAELFVYLRKKNHESNPRTHNR